MKKILFLLTALIALAACEKVTPPAPEEPVDPSVYGAGLTADPKLPNAEGACVLYYKAVSGSPFYNYTGDLYAHIGVVDDTWKHVQSNWGVNIDKCKFISIAKNLWKLPLEPTIRQYFSSGTTPVERIGVVVRSADATKQTEDLFIKVKDEKYQFVPAEFKLEAMPAGVQHGINYNADGSVTLVFYEKDKNNQRYDYCYLIGEFSDWDRKDEYVMNRDEQAGCWWYTMTEVDPNKEYMFQYYVGNIGGDRRRYADPYSEVVYEQYDKYVSATTYPDMPKFPSKTSGAVSAFQVNRPEYNWEIADYQIEDENDLIIYELLFRDFTQTRDINGALEKLDYLKNLGVNAIELMPIQEFSGADSWGYNPIAYFALEKAYGTREMYKKFIDECHKKGMAVIVDVVYNHVHEDHAMAGLYFDWGSYVPTSNNPWFNVTAPHPFSVFHDWNHENQDVRNHIKKSLTYLIEEYKVDGFRFDLTKGFTNKKSTESSASNYDASRVEILKDYGSHIKTVDPNAVVILEHFADSENNALGNAGMKVWRNANHTFRSSITGSAPDFNQLWCGTSVPFGTLVGFMESHDEERTCYGWEKLGQSASSSWGVIGVGEDWTNDKKMTADGPFFVVKNVTVTEAQVSNSSKPARFKIRTVGTWDSYNYGASVDGFKLTVGEGYKMTNGDSKDMRFPAAGTYDIYFCFDTETVWLMEAGQRPEEPEIIPAEQEDALTIAMRRAACNAAFCFMVPGPKMIWQFGELGYDVSIETGGRTGKKPLHWEYFDVEQRRGLYDSYADLLKFRRENPRFFDSDAEYNAGSEGSLKLITCSVDGKTFRVVGNFSKSPLKYAVPEGSWKDYKTAETVSGEIVLKNGEYRIIVK